MAIKAKDLEKVLLADEKKLVDELEKDIDQYLIKNYTGDSPVMYYPQQSLNFRVRNEIINLYNNAGWHVKYESYDDQRNGRSEYLIFTSRSKLTCPICGKDSYKECGCWSDPMGN